MPLSRLILSSGRSIDLSELRISATYDGLLEGQPSQHVNDFIVSSRLRVAKEACPGRPVHLITPERTYPDTPVHLRHPLERLPAVVCIGAFDSSEIDPAHDNGWYSSALTVVWFQDTTEIPSGKNAHPQLLRLPWDELAEDFEA
ncbi:MULTISPECIES: hypothetical protein [unclassified Streptomyces]|uniref:hypothetical protein n=1 Tax=unclassified Streptomyces TaxID=2593676 RepID=UPI0037FC9C05